MNFLLTFALLFAGGLSPARGSLWDLYKLITEVTGKNAFWYYASYGCYCGWGGKGQPKDDTDSCCQIHDSCYDNLLGYHCDAKLKGYQYSWHGGHPYCSRGSWCSHLSCQCDRRLALCLKRHLGSYRPRYRLHLKRRCR